MPRQRAVGPDEIASEIWIAGGDRLAELLCELMKRVVASGTIPPQWKGGRLARLYKGKGDAADCNSHRGLLIADHASKVFTSLLWPPIARVCDKRLPTEQCGCVRGRGTARVMHTNKLFARRAAAHKRPCALVFADLVKAFDRVLRAVVMGDSSIDGEGSSGERVRERWIEAGVPADVVNDAIAYVQTTGGVLSEAELHPGVLRLLRDLHDGTWFQLDGGYLIETNLGSRQGCKFGAFIFNLIYCRALDDLRCAPRNEGLLSVFEYYPDAAPWCHMACKKTVLHLWPHHMRCVTSPMWMMSAWVPERTMSFWRNCRGLLISCKVSSLVISWNSTGSHSKQNVCCTWLVAERSTRGEQLRDLLSNAQRQDLVLRNMCVARLVGSSATLCRVTNMSDHWSMVLVVWNVSHKRVLLLQTECISRLPRNS